MNHGEATRPNRLIWKTDGAEATCDLSGHFWAKVRREEQDERVVWSWMVIGYENQVLAAGQTGDLGAAQSLVAEWDRWVRRADTPLDSTDNPAPIAEDCTTYEPAWPQWHSSDG